MVFITFSWVFIQWIHVILVVRKKSQIILYFLLVEEKDIYKTAHYINE